MRLLLCLAAALLAATSAPAQADAPTRIVSLNQCLDAILV